MTAVQLRGLLQRIEGRFGDDAARNAPGPHDGVLRELVVQALYDRPPASVGPRPTGARRLRFQS